ncbi:MAG: hypothetical protein Kow0080_25710 [Candidatus Promineifilaceae bacterium]
MQRKTAVFGLSLFLLILLFMGRVLWPPARQAVGGLDARGLFYPWLSFARDAVWHGRLPLWDSSQFAGYPFLSNPQVAFFYPPTWLAILLPVRFGLTAINIFHIWLAGIGMYLFLQKQDAPPFAAALGGLTFAFSGFTAARVFAGHLGLLGVHAWLPWLLLASVWAVENGRFRHAVMAGIPLAMAVLAGHTTSLIYIGLAWLAYLIFLGISGQTWRVVLRQTAVTGITALFLSAVQLIPLAQFTLVSSRATEASLEFATAFSFPPAHLITLLIPIFFGEPTTLGYWSVPNFEELTYYAGLLPLLGLALALRRPTRRMWFFIVLAGVGLLLAFGSYGFLFEMVYRLLPPFRLARAPGRAAVWFTFAAAAWLGLAVAYWQGQPISQRQQALAGYWRWLLWGTAVTGAAALAAFGAVFTSQHPSDTSGRLWHQLGGWAWAAAALLIGGGLLRGYLLTDNARRRQWLAGGLLVLLLADLWLFGYRLIRLDSMQPPAIWPDAAALIGDTDYRVLPWGVSIFDQNGAGQVGLQSVFGYNALEVGANIALAASVPDPRSTAYDILGANYVLSYGPLDGYGDGERPLTLLGNTANVWVYERARTLPLVRLVTQAEVIPAEQEAIARVHAPDFDPATTAVLAEEPSCALAGAAAGTAVTQERRDGFWKIGVSSPENALLVLSETAYPGWQAQVDGRRVPIVKAYTAVQAVCVPPGEHVVTFSFRPTIFLWSGLVSLLAWVVVLWQVAGGKLQVAG